MIQIRWKPLLICLLISTVLVGGLSALLTMGSMQVYQDLVKPLLSPPGWLFPVVWTILFLLMGVASYLIYVSDAAPQEKYRALFLYGVQLILNFTWSIVFFRLQQYWLSVAVLAVLLVFILLCIWVFSKISRAAAWLLVPYALWVAFAGYLDLFIALNNR